jgi:hypothetical protein
MGKPFEYSGSLQEGLLVRTERSHVRIPAEAIAVIRREIQRRTPVLMGANRDPLVRNSVGETLRRDHGYSPQLMSYVLPLLIEEGFCTVSAKRPYVIRRT